MDFIKNAWETEKEGTCNINPLLPEFYYKIAHIIPGQSFSIATGKIFLKLADFVDNFGFFYEQTGKKNKRTGLM